MERRCHHLMLCRGGSSALTAPLKHCCCCPEHSEHCKLAIQRTSFVKNTSISGGGYSWVREGRWREKSKKASSPALNRNNPVALAGYNQRLYGGKVSIFPWDVAKRQKHSAGECIESRVAIQPCARNVWFTSLQSSNKNPSISLTSVRMLSFTRVFIRTCGANCITWRNLTRSEATIDYMY